ncbi:MAG: hypothetical protein ACRCXZ_05755 [Patescibacteria group bacterium]
MKFTPPANNTPVVLMLEEQQLINRPHLFYHFLLHTVTGTDFLVSAFEHLESLGLLKQGIFSSLPSEYYQEFKNTTFLAFLYHDSIFDIIKGEFGYQPDPSNEWNSGKRFLQDGRLINSVYPNNYNLGEEVIHHTKVGWDKTTGLVSSPEYATDEIKAVMQLLIEMADKGHCVRFDKTLSFDEQFLLTLVDNIALEIEMKARSQHDQYGGLESPEDRLEACRRLFDDYRNGDKVALFDTVIPKIISFIKISLVDHISQKVANRPFSSNAVSLFVEDFVLRYKQLAEYAKLSQTWNSDYKEFLVDKVFAILDAEINPK